MKPTKEAIPYSSYILIDIDTHAVMYCCEPENRNTEPNPIGWYQPDLNGKTQKEVHNLFLRMQKNPRLAAKYVKL